MTHDFYCPTCGGVGRPRNRNRGSSFVEVMLWLCFLIPGLCYTLWRMGRIDRFCRVCGAPNPIPVDAPMAQRALGSQSTGKATFGRESKSVIVPLVRFAETSSRQVGWKLTLGIFVAPYIFGWALARRGYSNVTRAVAVAWGLFMTVPLAIGFMSADANTQPKAVPVLNSPTIHAAKSAHESLHDEIVRDVPTLVEAVKERMRDPESVQFRDVMAMRPNSTNSGYVLCGLANARNGFGGYGEFVPFVMAGSTLVLNNSPIFDQFCTHAALIERVDVH